MVNRREFLLTAALPLAASAARAKPVICIFSKHMAQFNYDELGRNARQIGFAGVDLTVRAKGHVLPERVTEQLPQAVEAIRSHGLAVPMITTGITSPTAAEIRPTLRTAAQLKIPYWKPGYLHYDLANVEASLEKAREATAGMVALSREHGVQLGFHNHSGNYVGAPVWDIRAMLSGLDPKWSGYYFDPAHATIEGGLDGWRISQRLAASRLKMVALKDFYWAKKKGAWDVQWCPMGEGMVNWREVFRGFAQAGFAGPLSLHVEYEPADEMAAIAKDFEFIRKSVAEAYR